MSWESRNKQKYYYRVKRNGKHLVKTYFGSGATAKRAALEDTERREAREKKRTEYKQFLALDAQLRDLTMATTTLVNASLIGSGFHQHKREWRRRRHGNINMDNGGNMEMIHVNEITTTAATESLETLVRRGMEGDQEVLPAIRHMLDQMPALWKNAGTLATHVERAWLQTITGDDLVSGEVLERQLAMMKTALAGPAPTMLETLLVDRICACWLAVQQAELSATKRLQHHGVALSNAQENRIDKVHRRLLTAIRELARVRKLLTPEQKFQVNIGAQQIVS